MGVAAHLLAPNSVLLDSPGEDVAALAAACTPAVLRRGEYLYRQDDPTGEVFFVLEGAFNVLRRIGERRPLLLNATTAHDGSIGLRDLLVGRPRSTAVLARSDARVAVLALDDARVLFARHPGLLWTMVRELAAGSHRFAQLAADLGVLDLPRQVAMLLLEPTDSPGARGPESQADFASRLGAIRQSVNEVISMLLARNWIERHPDGTLSVRQPEQLRRFVRGNAATPRSPARADRRPATAADWSEVGGVLAALATRDAAALRAVSRIVTYAPGAVAFTGGTDLDHLVTVVDGYDLLTSDAGARGTFVHTVVPADGTMHGLTTVFADEPSPMSLVAQDHLRVLEVPRAGLAAALLRSPDALWLAGRDVALTLSMHVYATTELAVLNAVGRVASVLLANADEDGRIRPSLTQRQLGARVGLSRQSVNRALAQLQRETLVDVSDGEYRVIDGVALRRHVHGASRT